MIVTMRLRDRVVVEALEQEESRLPNNSMHRLDYQTGVIRLEFPNDNATLVALRMCGVFFPEA